MDNGNEVTFITTTAVTVPVGLAMMPIGPWLIGRSVLAMGLAIFLTVAGVMVLTGRLGRANVWNRTGMIFLLSGAFIIIGSVEIIMALFLALLAIDVLLGAFAGAEHLVNRKEHRSMPRSNPFRQTR